MKNRSTISSFAFVTMVSFLVTGCGGGSSTPAPTSTPTPTPTPTPASTPTPTPAPVSGTISLLAGNVVGGAGNIDGVGSNALFEGPTSMSIDGSGNLYVFDTGNTKLRRIVSPQNTTVVAGQPVANTVTTLASSPFAWPFAFDSAGNMIGADNAHNVILKVSPTGVVTTLAGSSGVSGSTDGTGTAASFNDPRAVTIDSAGNVYVADNGNDAIRKITPAGVVTTTVAKVTRNFPPLIISCNSPNRCYDTLEGLAVDGAGNLYVADTTFIYVDPDPHEAGSSPTSSSVRKITPDGTMTTLAGAAGAIGSTDGAGSVASFNVLGSLVVDASGNIFVADTMNSTIRKISPAGVVSTFAGSINAVVYGNGYGYTDGIGSAATFQRPVGLVIDKAGNLYVSDTNDNTIRAITQAGAVTTIAGDVRAEGYKDGPAASALFSQLTGVTTDGAGNFYLSEFSGDIRKIDSSGTVSTLIATGQTPPLNLWGPCIVADAAGNIYIADFLGSIRKLSSAGVLTTIAGTNGVVGYADGTGAAASFAGPTGIALDQSGNLYITDIGNESIRKITPAGVVTTLAGSHGVVGTADGTGAAASFGIPEGIAVDAIGNVYVADMKNDTLRKITPAGVVTTLAGTAGLIGSADGTGSAASFNAPMGVAVDKNGNVYVADTGNNTIRKVTPSGVVTTIAGKAGSVGVALGSLPGSLDNPVAISIDASGVLYVAQSGGVVKIQLQ